MVDQVIVRQLQVVNVSGLDSNAGYLVDKLVAGDGVTITTVDLGANGLGVSLEFNVDTSGLGTLALQDADDVAITGGVIDGTDIGQTTPALGTFTTLIATAGTLDGVAVGATTPGTGAFTTLDASGLISADGGQIQFPATQNPSADPNTLDDYEEGTWTPSITFTIAGDLNVVYSTQVGAYTKIGNTVVTTFFMNTSTFTHTSAGGFLRLNGFPFTASDTSSLIPLGNTEWQGITKAGYTDISPRMIGSSTDAQLRASGSGVAIDPVGTGDMPTGGTPIFNGTVTYFT